MDVENCPFSTEDNIFYPKGTSQIKVYRPNATNIIASITSEMASAETPYDQINCSKGLPIVFSVISQRYSLAPQAENVLQFIIENDPRRLRNICLHRV